jgi:integrase
LATDGLRTTEAHGADIDDLDLDRGHRTLGVVREGGKQVTIVQAPLTARARALYIGERATGPIFLGVAGGRMDRYAADRTVKRLARRAGSRSETSGRMPRTLTSARPCATTGLASPSTGTPPTSWLRSSPEPSPDTDSTTGRHRARISPGRAGYPSASAGQTPSDTECI